MRTALTSLFLTVALAACGGGGGGGDGGSPPPPPPPPPPPATYNLSGTLAVAPTAAVDGDTNDVNQSPYVINDDLARAQALSAPVTLVGTVNVVNTGPQGRNFAPGDADDYFIADLVAGQVVELEFASDPAQADVDLYVFNGAFTIGGASDGVDSRYECVRVATSGRYYINVYAFRNASIFNLRIGAPGSAGSCANVTAPLAAARGQLLAQARPQAAQARARSVARLQAAGVRGAQLEGAAAALPQLLQLPGSAALQTRARQTLAGEPVARALTAQAAESAAAAPTEPETVRLQKLAKRLRGEGAFAYVQPNWIENRFATVGEFPPSDRGYSYQRWHYEQINLPAAMSRITQLATQPVQRPIVAVIDDGVVLDHPDLSPQLFSAGRSFISNTTAGDGNSATGDNPSRPADEPVFHGTHVAGTAGAATYDGIGGAGTAPMALILPLRVFPPDRGAAQVDVINAMLYAAGITNNSGTLPARRADVINLSLGGDRPCDAAYQDAVTRVRNAGVIVVAAAGNSGRNDIGQRAAVGSPANCTGVVAVSALDAQRQLARYSNTGAQIALAAPGGNTGASTTGNGAPDGVYSAVATFDANGTRQPSFGAMQGTSMASPHVAGVMALMRYVNKDLTVTQVDNLLAAGALSDEIGAAGRDIDFGFGVVNALKAVNAALGAAGTPPPPAPAGSVQATPSSIDFGSFQTSATLTLALSAAGTETVSSVTSDNAAVTVTPTAIDNTTRLGTYTVAVNRAALPVGGSFPRLTVTLSPARSFTVQLSVTKPVTGGGTAAGDVGPLYVLLINPDTGSVVRTVLATRSASGYTWASTAWPFAKVQITAGGDLNNDDIICQRGEPCGAFPVLAPGRDLTVVTLSGNRSDISFEVAPLSGISPQAAPGGGDEAALQRRKGAPR